MIGDDLSAQVHHHLLFNIKILLTMKNLLLVCLMVCSNLCGLSAQGSDFAPIGAKWYYTQPHNFQPKIIPHIIECVAIEQY